MYADAVSRDAVTQHFRQLADARTVSEMARLPFALIAAGASAQQIDQVSRVVAEWQRGCSCSSQANPAECDECTDAAIRAIERALA